jgi:hypothetical protein
MCGLLTSARAGEVFVEAESFHSKGGWEIIDGADARSASGVAVLGGSKGDAKGRATRSVEIKDAGHYRIWVRYSSRPAERGPFRVAALAGGREVGSAVFDTESGGKSARDPDMWNSFDADLPEGDVVLQLSKHEEKNCSGLARRVDCLLLTMDDKLVPNHLHYGAQTFVRVRTGEGYEKPVYIHLFADHFHAPWYQHYSLGRSGAVAGTAPGKGDLLKSGEQTAWCNLTPMIYQDSGTMVTITARHSYTEQAKRMRGTFEFATEPDEKAIVRTVRADYEPSGFGIFLPPNLLTPENRALCKTSHEIAEEAGRLADAHAWPTYGRKPERFPFFASIARSNDMFRRDATLDAREQKTFDYFGFTDERLRRLGGAWLMKNGSYCQPDLEKMKARIAAEVADFKREGGDVKRVVFCEVTDEPTGQPLELMAKDPAYQVHFREWLRGLGKMPADLLVADWDAVRTVTEAQRDQFPALYLYSQRFRTRALGDFMATQRRMIEEACGTSFPVLANFSDGAIYGGNFCMQGVDYFELLDSPEQNAIWGEDWSNHASTYQCASFNVDLMRAAARERGQTIGHHLVAHAGRTPWDIKLKATSELARGVKILNNFSYGPTWATHEGGPYWRSHVWQGKPETWTANASLTREVGAVEDMLLTAMPALAKVALLYSSSSDAWTIGGNLAYGFDRMHTWLALAHAQVPVDIVAERQVERGGLGGYAVCYLSGPNLARAAAEKLKAWVQRGGTLCLTAGAATRDEFNRPLDVLDDLLPATRGECVQLQAHSAAGKFIRALAVKDEARWEGGSVAVLSVKQTLTPRSGAAVLAKFKDGSPAIVHAGRVTCVGFLPALAYIKDALDARAALEERSPKDPLLARSANPWEFPAVIRDLILSPVREAGVAAPIECSTALVDAVFMPHEKGVLIPLANYTNQSIADLALKVNVPKPVVRAESAVHGGLKLKQAAPLRVELSLPLENNDFVKLYFE